MRRLPWTDYRLFTGTATETDKPVSSRARSIVRSVSVVVQYPETSIEDAHFAGPATIPVADERCFARIAAKAVEMVAPGKVVPYAIAVIVENPETVSENTDLAFLVAVPIPDDGFVSRRIGE